MGITRGSAFPSKYLGKEDVPQPMAVVVGNVFIEQIQGDHGMDDKVVLKFTNAAIKSMIVNSTNWDTLESAYGPDSDGWLNKPVELFVDPSVMYAGKRVGGLRVRVPTGLQTPAAAPANTFLLDWEDAQAQAAAVGITKDNLIAALKAQGHTAYNPLRDTPAVQALIAAKAQPQEESFDAVPPAADDSLPFS